jgi:hypothetical protein
MGNWLPKPLESADENLTGCPEKHGVLGYERKRKYLFVNASDIVLHIILREANLISITGRKELVEKGERSRSARPVRILSQE